MQVAYAEKNARECVCLLRNMLAALCTSWDMSSSPLFYRVNARTFDWKQMLSAILSELERDSAYSFLQNCTEYKELISEYKALMKKEEDMEELDNLQ